VISIHKVFAFAVHEQPLAVDIDTVPVPPFTPKERDVGEMEYVQEVVAPD